jgi:hypothetical protein
MKQLSEESPVRTLAFTALYAVWYLSLTGLLAVAATIVLGAVARLVWNVLLIGWSVFK